jgi:predicted RNA binding protein YcfA (HicA-like mRNA interferase family)
MKSVSGKQFAKILERKGWQLICVQGSHHIYTKPGESIRISVPIHGNKDLKIGLLRHFMKQANFSESDLD